jgi:hypothetical protein
MQACSKLTTHEQIECVEARLGSMKTQVPELPPAGIVQAHNFSINHDLSSTER